MDNYTPPFTITNSILSYVASISEKLGCITRNQVRGSMNAS